MGTLPLFSLSSFRLSYAIPMSRPFAGQSASVNGDEKSHHCRAARRMHPENIFASHVMVAVGVEIARWREKSEMALEAAAMEPRSCRRQWRGREAKGWRDTRGKRGRRASGPPPPNDA